MKGHLPLTEEQQEWLIKVAPAKRPKPNPCIAFFGPGPAGKICKDCLHLIRRVGSGTRVWFKCEFNGPCRGVATDHKAKWPACARFEEVPR
jgi:hypothetical protein